MAASTITRGTFVDGTTPWNSSNISALIYDRIDQMFSGVGGYATLELGGALKINGALTQLTNDGGALGTSSLGWSDLFLASGAVINFNNGDVTLTHSTNTLTFAGASSGYIFNDGNVGIGTSSPSARLHVNGVAGSTTAFFNQANTGKTGIILAENGVARGYLSQVGLYAGNSDGNFGIFVETGYNFQIATNGSATSKFTVTTGGNIAIGATARLYLDGVAGTGDTYLEEVTANEVRIVAGGNERLRAVGSNGIKITGALTVPSGTPIYLDGSFSGDTYILESSANTMDFYVGGNHRVRILDQALASYGTTGIGFYASNGGTNTGTTVVRNGTDGYLYLTTSSRRFKENIAPAAVTDAQLDAFMATTPSWWDYKGQKNGALGFIAEDLAALPLDRYGFNPLVNYDGNGQIESNRDYALIAMHHLVIQRLERKIAALEARIY